MMARCPALRIVFIIILCSVTFSVVAQPALPDIEGKADSDKVTLRWTSPYSNIKSIAVLRSPDNINYATIGNLYKVSKGEQEYVDEHAAGGNSYYKLTITFRSGLNWSSNHCKVSPGRPGDTTKTMQADSILPANKQPDIQGANNARQTGNTPYPNTSSPAKRNEYDTAHIAANAVPQNMAVADPPLKRFVLKTDDTI